MLEVQDLSVTLAGKRLLHGITLTARPGTVTAIVGPNGSGKTTLLRALTGEIVPQGTARLNGLAITGADPRRMAAMRGVLAQETQVAFAFSVAEIVAMGAEAATGPQDPGCVQRVLDEVGLQGYGPRPYHLLSGGERQRVQLARVLAQIGAPTGPGGARWLFLDEPVSSLDIGHQLMVMRLARRFADAGGGVLAVLHDLNLTAMSADQVLLLQAGQALAQGTPDQVLTDQRLELAYGCPIRTRTAPGSGWWLLPQAAG